MRFKIVLRAKYNDGVDGIVDIFYASNWSEAKKIFNNWLSTNRYSKQHYDLDEL